MPMAPTAYGTGPGLVDPNIWTRQRRLERPVRGYFAVQAITADPHQYAGSQVGRRRCSAGRSPRRQGAASIPRFSASVRGTPSRGTPARQPTSASSTECPPRRPPVRAPLDGSFRECRPPSSPNSRAYSGFPFGWPFAPFAAPCE